jgi:D-beta-D-heptose 7-phosphate kinase/D-beta-D-heptose 1-phosphate adenosyltransferase
MGIYEEIKSKIISPDQASVRFTEAFRKQHRLVFTNGCFDLLHRGHVYYLSHARELGDLLVVGLNSDASVSRLKGPGRPVNTEQSRAEVLGALTAVDHIIIFSEDTPIDLIRSLKPHVLVKGGDYKKEEIVGYREVVSWGGEVVTIPLLEGFSTTSMIKKSR